MIFSLKNIFKGTVEIILASFFNPFVLNNKIYPADNNTKIIGNMRVSVLKRFSINIGIEYSIPNIKTTRTSKNLLNMTIAAAADLDPNFANLYHFTTPPDMEPGRNAE
jgi:hypothetical protein